ncbi:lysM domain receptor-like kinase 3 [Ipomoea triloba]|uniref:lysM domain receptor-like kinase 3 n=1 Tax=Ipomoea triloba TaxID=35885 RepID=UPI00125DB882|nr:lysM domain receptor-like kinase 3 [Ipomoea triloba]XP_031120088.1 lysM domain receptor-like kinase 3 [Ipomoea triloba]
MRHKAGILIVLFGLFVLGAAPLCSSYPNPLNCSDPGRLCSSFLAFKPGPDETLPVIQSMFDVLPHDITVEGNGRDYVFIRKNCSCAPGNNQYLTNTTFTVRESNGSVYDLVIDAYDGLAYFPTNFTREAKKGAVVSLKLMCGCSSGLWNYLMSYVMEDGDSVESLASRFGVSMDNIESVNGIQNPDNFTAGALYYIPLNSVPGEPYPVKNDTLPAPVPAPSDADITGIQTDHKRHVPYRWIIGGLGVGLALIVIIIVALVSFRSSNCFSRDFESHAADSNQKSNSHKFQILRNTSLCCASGRSICCKLGDWKEPNAEPSNRQMNNIPKVIGTDVFDMEKPLVFTYEEIFSSTDGFSDANLLGNGTYGSVYYGLLRDQEVTIKRMTATKTKEFMAEMKLLCKVHHTNLVELIGYAASNDELFLIYEYAQKGSLRSHLHDPQNKGHTSLSWIMRIQIALDAARGLEYIHEHTKPHYVHRDIKTSNIVLDGSFKAKISDFGLSKLVGITNDGEASVTRVVGTYGYVAPEYLRDGLATTKSDVYAFGVVLFEIISGKEAVTRTEGGTAVKNTERRSLVSIMLAALKNSPDSTSMSALKECVDSNLMDLYPHDCLFKLATLARQCVDDDPILRPDMKQVVISLSQILLSSVEWEATLAGNSQVFSGLVQGR